MRWHELTTQAWQEPLDVAAGFASADMALLYSARAEHYTGHHSYLLLEPEQTWQGRHWAELPPLPEGDDALPYYAGYLGYGLRNEEERLSRGQPGYLEWPDFMLVRYRRLIRFDHAARHVTQYSLGQALAPLALKSGPVASPAPTARELHSNFTRAQYQSAVQATLDQIAAGNFYQANLTRKFTGRLSPHPDYFALYRQLCTASAAPFSAYMRHGERAVLSSSPESFLSIAGDQITTRPIKGSAPRGANPATDERIRSALLASSKNQAENLMITDLMRHDLARVSQPGSVRVAEQSGLYSYSTIHHLISTIHASKSEGASTYDVVRACFPPGSMTGAPKMAAMEWCTAQEKLERGVYSGALGWFGAGGRCDLSVVIRTLLCEGDRFEFQVGGGIVADSTPEEEWRETLVKARGIARALGLAETDLEAL